MSVAIVHDYLNQRGGAERVVVELARIFPGAPVYTSLYRPDSTFPEFKRLDVRTSPLDRLPVDQRFRALLPLYPAAFSALSPLHEDVVVSSSSGWAHGIRTDPGGTHVVYCHTPARWLYETDAYLPGRGTRAITTPLRAALGRWDRNAAHRADLYLANSEHVARRIRAAYGIEARLLHPPVRTDGLRAAPRGERLLVISRLLPYKRVDLVVDAATEAGIGLDIVGSGPSLAELQERAGPSVTFHGRVEEETLRELLLSCRTLCFPGSEDFGIVPVEANAAGKPVVAFAEGGVLETQIEGRTATFFREPTPAAALDAIRRADDLSSSPSRIAENAERFSPEVFRSGLLAAIDEAKRLRSAR